MEEQLHSQDHQDQQTVQQQKGEPQETRQENQQQEDLTWAFSSPPSDQQQKTQQEERIEFKIAVSKSKLTKIIASALAVIILLVGGIAYYNYATEKEVEEKYRTDMLSAANLMRDAVSKAEYITNQYSQVWHDAIFSDSGIDFSFAVMLKQGEFSEDIKNLKSQLNKINGIMKQLNQPPEEYEEAYKYLLQLHSITSKYVNMAESPSGTLETFNRDINQYSSDFASTYDTFKTLVPESK